MSNYTKENVLKFIQGINDLPNDKSIEKISAYFSRGKSPDKSVLGIDIYRYSKYEGCKQDLIPIAFDEMYERTVSSLIALENSIFNNCSKDWFLDGLIETGDGLFQILDNPLQGLLFATWFQLILALYNSSELLPEIRKITGKINLRYSLTTGSVFKFVSTFKDERSNHYGDVIIRNARILSRDKLNRFLLDEASVDWFSKKTHGIESLKVQSLDDLKKIGLANSGASIIFSSNTGEIIKNQILSINLQNIGEASIKSEVHSIYTLHIQVNLTYKPSNDNPAYNVVITIGNLNVQGLVQD